MKIGNLFIINQTIPLEYWLQSSWRQWKRATSLSNCERENTPLSILSTTMMKAVRCKRSAYKNWTWLNSSISIQELSSGIAAQMVQFYWQNERLRLLDVHQVFGKEKTLCDVFSKRREIEKSEKKKGSTHRKRE